jgi:hypothetical protein
MRIPFGGKGLFPMKLSPQAVSADSHTKSHPLLTVLLFGGAILGLVAFGSHFSKQRSMARDGGDALAPYVSVSAPAKP